MNSRLFRLLSFTFFLLVLSGRWAGAQPYGLSNAAPIGGYLNGTLPTASPNSSATYDVTVAFTNLVFNQPLYLTQYPGTNYLVVIEKAGVIRLFPNRPNASAAEVKTFIDIQSRIFNVSDSGMTCIAFHPEFGVAGSTNRGYVYITYKWRPNPDLGANPDFAYYRLSRFTVPDGTMAADPNSEVILLQQFDQQEWHDSGCLMFGQDGYLYFGVGDEGGANDQYNVTQVLNQRLMSGVFRIDVNKNSSTSHPIRRQPFHHPNTPAGWPESFSTNYYVPNDNPWVNVAATNLEEYYALGFRNPYRFSQDPATGRIWVGDVGQDTREEVDTLFPGHNYQWAYTEGTTAGPKAKPSSVIGIEQPPIWDYPHANGDGCVIGGYVYHGTNFPGLVGKYVFCDNDSGRIWAMVSSNGVALDSLQQIANMPPGSVYGGTSSCGMDASGEIYFVKIGGVGAGQIYKLKTIVNFVPDPAPTLSQLGLFTDLAALTPVAGFHPYTVNSPLWSDGAVKTRWLAVPNDGVHDSPSEQIVFSPTNEWKFPQGTVFVKHFELPVNDTNSTIRQRVETRLLVVDQNNSVYGLTYKWRADGSDADLLETGTNANFVVTGAGGVLRTQVWSFPSRQDCLICHNANAGYVLGVKTHQLNCPTTYPETGVTDNQLRALGNIGLLGTNYSEAQLGSYLRSYAVTNTSASLEVRVRSYLDANCSQCHRPNGVQAYFDARFVTPLSQQGIIQGPSYTFITDTNDRVVVPQDLAHSLIYNRASRVGQFQMPPIAKNVVDTNAISVIASWINSLVPGPGVGLTTAGATVTGPFSVQVRFTAAVTGLTSNAFQVVNGVVTSFSGSGAVYNLTVLPVSPGSISVRLPEGQAQDGSGNGNYDSNVLLVNYSPLDPALITWLKFDDATGSIAVDDSAHGNDGLLNNLNNGSWVNGLFGGALSFNGINGFVSISNVAGGDFTLSCWIKSTQAFPVTDLTYEGDGIIWSDVGGVANDFILGGTRSAGGVDRLSFFTGNPDTAVNGATKITTGQWMHLAVTRNSANGQLSLYVNGQLDVTGTGGTNFLNANQSISIGGNTLDGRYFAGLMDDVRIYSRVLAAGEISNLYQLYVGPSLSPISDTGIFTNSSTGPLSFTITNGTIPLNALTLSVVSSNPALVPTNNIIFGGSGSNRTVTLTPLANQSGTSFITITVSDGQMSSTRSFLLTVGKGLVAYYPFEGNALDASGFGNNGTPVGAIGYGPGRVGVQAVNTDGTNSYVQIPVPATGDFTIAFWEKTTDIGPGGQWFQGKGFVDGDTPGPNADFGTALIGSNFAFGVGNPNTTITSTNAVNDGTWHHLAVTRNSTSGAMVLYVDGVPQTSGTGPTGARTAPTTLRIGGVQTGGAGSYLKVVLDDLRFYDVALSAAQIQTLPGYGPPAPTGLFAVAGNGQVLLGWNPSSGASGYNVKRATTSGGPYNTTNSVVVSTNYLDLNANNNVTYFYIVTGVNSNGEGAASAEVSVTPRPALEISTSVSAGNFVLSWPGWASNYSVYTTTNLSMPGVWVPVTNGLQPSNSQFYLNMPMTNARQFFRLSLP